VDPAELEKVLHSERDLNIVDPQALAAWWRGLGGGSVLDKVLRTEYVLRYHVPVYVIVHEGVLPDLGEPVYRDDFVTIYLLSAGQ
jgi:hypothetical protein